MAALLTIVLSPFLTEDLFMYIITSLNKMIFGICAGLVLLTLILFTIVVINYACGMTELWAHLLLELPAVKIAEKIIEKRRNFHFLQVYVSKITQGHLSSS